MTNIATRLSKEVDFKTVCDHFTGRSHTEALAGNTFIDLRDIFEKHLGKYTGSSERPEEEQFVKSFSLDKGILRMVIERRDKSATGEIWIQLSDFTLMRAVENGVLVYPTRSHIKRSP